MLRLVVDVELDLAVVEPFLELRKTKVDYLEDVLARQSTLGNFVSIVAEMTEA